MIGFFEEKKIYSLKKEITYISCSWHNTKYKRVSTRGALQEIVPMQMQMPLQRVQMQMQTAISKIHITHKITNQNFKHTY